MKDTQLKDLVFEAISLEQNISQCTNRLKEIKTLLVNEARSREDEHVATEGGGSSWTTQSTNGCARVTFPGAKLKATIKGEGKCIEKIKEVAGKLFARLFIPSVTYKPVPNFRDEAAALMGRTAGKLIKLCEGDASPTVSFETTERES